MPTPIGPYAIVSVDDHVVEPPDVWQTRLPGRIRERGPRIEEVSSLRGRRTLRRENSGFKGEPVECWVYEDLVVPTKGLAAASGRAREDYSFDAIGYSDMREGAYSVGARIDDMDADGVLASLCFPTFPRFCGQTFLEAKDKDLALLCVQAWNDWMIDEWCAAAPGRFIPTCITPLWDVGLAIGEVHRCAAKGARAVIWSENPSKLDLPSIHDADGYWEPFFAAVAETGMPLCVHIGSSSDTIVTSPDAPKSVFVGLVPFNAPVTAFDWLMSGVFERHPGLRLALSEGGIGWLPYVLERADYTFEHQGAWTDTRLTRPPSTQFADHVYGCFIDDPHGLRVAREIGIDNIMIETDYPHSDSTWPYSQELAEERLAGFTHDERHKICRGNAERLFRFQAG